MAAERGAASVPRPLVPLAALRARDRDPLLCPRRPVRAAGLIPDDAGTCPPGAVVRNPTRVSVFKRPPGPTLTGAQPARHPRITGRRHSRDVDRAPRFLG